METAFDLIVGRSPLIEAAKSLARDAAASSATLLFRGESGTGKEVFARAVHRASNRSDNSFVVVHCGALPESLLESELFGHARGAFTGALAEKRGLFEEAHNGSIFLDEIGELSLTAQVRLLRVIQNGEIRRVGAQDSRQVDVRVLAATHRDLRKMYREGRFREDLFHRLNVISIELPSLRDRREDILPLTEALFEAHAAKARRPGPYRLTDDVLRALLAWDWPGNVRELENVVVRALALSKDRVIRRQHLPENMLERRSDSEPSVGESPLLLAGPYAETRRRFLRDFERSYVEAVLAAANGNLGLAARIAGTDRSNFKKIVTRSGVSVDVFRRDDESEPSEE